MKTSGWVLLLLIAAGAGGAGGYWYARHHGEPAETEAKAEAPSTEPAGEDQPVVPVTTAPLARRTIVEKSTVYGTVVSRPGDVRVLSVPFESRVVRVLASPGQALDEGADVVEVEASPDALLGLQEAKLAVDAATRDLRQIEQRVKDQLATNQELSQGQQVLASARIKLESMTERGIARHHQLKAGVAGFVSKLNVQEGQIVPAGASLAEIAPRAAIEVVLGVAAIEAASLKPGQTLRVRTATSSPSEWVDGRVRMVTGRVDPATRLVPVSVTVPGDTGMPIDAAVVGEIENASANALTAPRESLQPDEEGHYTLFTVRGDQAARHTVRLGLQDDHDVQVIADDLEEGESVVVAGSYLLTDGMHVEAREPATEPATRPADEGTSATTTRAGGRP